VHEGVHAHARVRRSPPLAARCGGEVNASPLHLASFQLAFGPLREMKIGQGRREVGGTYAKQALISSWVKSVPATLALNRLQASPVPVALGPGAVAVPVREEPVARGVPVAVAVAVRVMARDDSRGSVPLSWRRSSSAAAAGRRPASGGGGGERRCFSRSRMARAGAAAARAKAKAFMLGWGRVGDRCARW
jgi:hypothetical protein